MIGIESSRSELYNQISKHPEWFFFILVFGGRAGLCIQTCDRHGEDIMMQEIGGIMINSEGNSTSVFQEELQVALSNMELCPDCPDGVRYPITPAIKNKICRQPGFIDWTMTYLLKDGRCLLLDP